MPDSPTVVRTATSPIAVSNRSRPGPCRSAMATAVAIVACPQKPTSARGLKKRNRNASAVGPGSMNAVSE